MFQINSDDKVRQEHTHKTKLARSPFTLSQMIMSMRVPYLSSDLY